MAEEVKPESVPTRYFGDPLETPPHFGVQMDLESGLALKLIEHFGSIAGTADGEDTAGRAKLALQEPAQLVERCFSIAEAFIAKAQARGGFRPAISLEERLIASGLLEKLKSEHTYGENPATSITELKARIAQRKAEHEEREKKSPKSA